MATLFEGIKLDDETFGGGEEFEQRVTDMLRRNISTLGDKTNRCMGVVFISVGHEDTPDDKTNVFGLCSYMTRRCDQGEGASHEIEHNLDLVNDAIETLKRAQQKLVTQLAYAKALDTPVGEA